MRFSAADIAGMIDGAADDVLLSLAGFDAIPSFDSIVSFDGSTYSATVRGIFRPPGKVESMFDGGVVSTTPTLVLSPENNSAVTLNATVITVDGQDYQAYESIKQAAGFYILSLTKDY